MSSGFAKHCFEEAYKAGWNDCVRQLENFEGCAAEYGTDIDIFAKFYDGPSKPEEDGYDEDNMSEAWRSFAREEWHNNEH